MGVGVILKVRSNIFGDCFGNEVLKVMLQFCLVDVRLLVAYSLPLPLSYPKKKVGEPKEEIRNLYGITKYLLCEFVFVNLLVRLQICEFTYKNSLHDFIYVNSYNL